MQVVQNTSLLSPQSVSNVLWALAHMDLRSQDLHPQLLCLLDTRALQCMHLFPSQAVANTIWASAHLCHVPPPALLSAMQARIVETAATWEPIAISTVLWGMATLQIRPSNEVWEALVARAAQTLDKFGPQAVSNVLWAVATLASLPPTPPPPPSSPLQEPITSTSSTCGRDEELQRRLVAELFVPSLNSAADFGPQAIANTLWALATLKLSPPPALLVSLQTTAAVTRETWRPQGIAITLWSLASLGVELLPALLRRLLSEAVKQADDFSPQSVANLLWATATMRLDPGRELVRVLTLRSVQCAGEFNAQSISMLLWSLASSEHEISPALASAITTQAVECGHEFTPQGISCVLWAFATLKVVPEATLLDTLLQQSVVKHHMLDAQATANLLWSLAALGEQELPDSLVHALLQAILRTSPDFLPQGVANTLWSLVCLQPGPAHRPALRRAVDSLAQQVLIDWPAYRDLDLMQLHQFFVETRLHSGFVAAGDAADAGGSVVAKHATMWGGEGEGEGDLPANVLELRGKVEGECRRLFEIRKTRSSALQREVGKALVSLGYALVEEASCAFTGYSLDFVVFSPAKNASSHHRRMPEEGGLEEGAGAARAVGSWVGSMNS